MHLSIELELLYSVSENQIHLTSRTNGNRCIPKKVEKLGKDNRASKADRIKFGEKNLHFFIPPFFIFVAARNSENNYLKNPDPNMYVSTTSTNANLFSPHRAPHALGGMLKVL